MYTALIWLTMNSAIAAQPGGPYVEWKTYRAADGLPSDKVLAVCVQGDTIWAGTDKGLGRFDGSRWRTYSTRDGLCHSAVTSLDVDPDTGDLWIATMGGACRMSAGRFDTFNQLNSGLANDLVYAVKVIRGKVWLATAAGTSRYDPARDRWSIFTETNTPMHEIWCYALGADSQKVYVGVWGGGVLEYDEWRDYWRDHTDPDREMEIDLFRDDGLSSDVVSSVATSSDGLLWVSTYFGLSSYDGRRWKNYYEQDSPLASNFINYVGTQGSVAWICTDRGLNAIGEEGWWTYRRDPGSHVSGTAVRHLPDGSEQVYRSRGTLPHDYVLGIDFQGDDLWVATAEGLAHGRRDEKAVAQLVQNPPRPVVVTPKRQTDSMARYGNAPPGAIAYRQFADPYLFFFQQPQPFHGPGRDKHPAVLPETVRIGVMAPLDEAPDSDLGEAMLQGIRLALDEANQTGGYRGRPYEIVLRKDLGLWGASSNEMVAFSHDDHVWAVIGPIAGDNTHIALRAALKLDLPMVNTANTDPTLTETAIPWILRCMADDRQQGYALAVEIIQQLKLKRIAVLRANDRYGRLGIAEFRDAARRMKRPLLAELNFLPHESTFERQLARIEQVRPEALVIWANASDTARIVRAVRARKMDVKIFGTDRMVSDRFLDAAGHDAEGVVAVSTFNPASQDAKWTKFRGDYRRRFHQTPESFAAHGYDGAKILVAAIEKAGLNRIRIMDELRAIKSFEGVTGPISLDATLADVGPVWLATVEKGKFVFRPSALRDATASADVPIATVADRGNTAPDEFVIGAFLPSLGIDAELTHSVRQGIELAFQTTPHAFRLVVYDKAEPWGRASSALVDMVYQDHALAIIGGVDRNATHLAEQVAVKAGLPVLTPTCSDPSVTRVPIPWIFRCALRRDDPIPEDGESSPEDGELSYPVDRQRMAEFSRLFEATYGHAPDLSAALGYDTAQLLIDTITRGATTRVDLRNRLASRPPFAAVTGPIQFDSLGNRRVNE